MLRHKNVLPLRKTNSAILILNVTKSSSFACQVCNKDHIMVSVLLQIQVIKIETEDNRETRSAKDALLLWCQMKTAGWAPKEQFEKLENSFIHSSIFLHRFV